MAILTSLTREATSYVAHFLDKQQMLTVLFIWGKEIRVGKEAVFFSLQLQASPGYLLWD